MLNVLSKVPARPARLIVRTLAKAAKLAGFKVRKDRGESCRYFLQSKHDHYILSARKKVYRVPATKEGDTYMQYHAGYLSLYAEKPHAGRYMWDIPQRDEGMTEV